MGGDPTVPPWSVVGRVRRNGGFLPDTSCMVAPSAAGPERHEAPADEIDRRLRLCENLVIAGPALVEV